MRGHIALLVLALAGCEPAKVDDTGASVGDSGARSVDADRDGSPEGEDCDDSDADVNPNAAEVCDGVDNDCDGLVDDADGDLTGADWYTDSDGDGYGDDATAVSSCTQPADTVDVGGDCDDADQAYHPGALEEDCLDPADYNCDGSTGYSDNDGDGFAACDECDDGDPLSYPGADEVCDGADNDCDGLTDDDDDDVTGTSTWYHDNDGDGYGDDAITSSACEAPDGSVADGGDCDDTSPSFHPGATEDDCSDPNDYNCDGSVAYTDADGDGVPACEDCDDADDATYPGAPEVCDDADNDCDGLTDDADSSLSGASTWYQDLDDDGFGSSTVTTTACDPPAGYVAYGSDCDDRDDDVNPAASEVCDGDDNDCDGATDDADSSLSGGSTWYRDADSDGYGVSTSTKTACSAPTGYVAAGTDCNDSSASVNPAASEICDSIDNDCDGLTDDSDSSVTGTSTWYRDADSDNYGVTTTTKSACSKPTGYCAASGDCNDSSASINPGATELCNSKDDDCDGLTDDDDPSLSDPGYTWYVDDDGDGYGTDDDSVSACSKVDGTSSVGGDCDDGDDDINPGAAEKCDAIDNDCSDYIDDDASCPCDVAWYGDHAYMFCDSASTWSSAKTSCSTYGYGLTSIGSSGEDDWIATEIEVVNSGYAWWIGYNDSSTEGTWVWSDGSTSTYTGWASGQPNGSRYMDQDCAALIPNDSEGWYDYYCSYYYVTYGYDYDYLGYICETD